MGCKVLIRKINKLLSKELNYLKLNKELKLLLNTCSTGDIRTLKEYLIDNSISILNDKNITIEFDNLLNNILKKDLIDKNVEKIFYLTTQLYKPKNITFSYKQHCNEILTLLMSIINHSASQNQSVINYTYDLLYEKLLINKLNSIETINNIINNDLIKYISSEKLILVKDMIKDLLILNGIDNITDMKNYIDKIKNLLSLDNNRKVLSKGINMSNFEKKLTIEDNDFDFSENESESNEEELESIGLLDSDVEPDGEFSAEDLTKSSSLSNNNKGIKKAMKKKTSLNSIITTAETQNIIKDAPVLVEKLPNEESKNEFNLAEGVKVIALELSKVKKAINLLNIKQRKALSISTRELLLNKNYTLLSTVVGELEEIVEELEEKQELLEVVEQKQELLEQINELEDEITEVEEEMHEGVLPPPSIPLNDSTPEVLNRRSRQASSNLNRNLSYKATDVNLSAAKNFINRSNKSALDILMSKETN